MQKKIFQIVLSFLFITVHGQEFEKNDIYKLSKLVEYSISEITPIFNNGKMYYTLNGEKINNENYDIAFPFFNKSAIVKIDNKYGVINKKGEFIIKPIFNRFTIYEYEKGLAVFDNKFAYNLYEAKEAKNWSIVCKKIFRGEFSLVDDNKPLKKIKYDTIYFSNENFFIAKKEGKIGVVDNNGKQISKFIYEEVKHSSPYEVDKNTYSLKKNNKWIYFSGENKITESDKECINFSTKVTKSIGLFKVENKFNILFTNGEFLNTNFDFISENGFIGIKGKKIFIIKSLNSIELFNLLK